MRKRCTIIMRVYSHFNCDFNFKYWLNETTSSKTGLRPGPLMTKTRPMRNIFLYWNFLKNKTILLIDVDKNYQCWMWNKMLQVNIISIFLMIPFFEITATNNSTCNKWLTCIASTYIVAFYKPWYQCMFSNRPRQNNPSGNRT